MDQELIAYFDARFNGMSRQFAETNQQIADLRQEMNQRFEKVDQRFDQMDQRFELVDQRFELVEEAVRHTVVLLEDVRSEVHVVAEGFLGLNERVERYRQESTLTFEQVKGWIEPYFKHLDGRVRNLESWADRQQWDVLESIQRLLGKLPPKKQTG